MCQGPEVEVCLEFEEQQEHLCGQVWSESIRGQEGILAETWHKPGFRGLVVNRKVFGFDFGRNGKSTSFFKYCKPLL